MQSKPCLTSKSQGKLYKLPSEGIKTHKHGTKSIEVPGNPLHCFHRPLTGSEAFCDNSAFIPLYYSLCRIWGFDSLMVFTLLRSW